MTRERSQLAVSRLTVPLLVVLVAAVVVVSAVLAYETYRARRSLRVTAERALAQYATMAGWELDAAVRARLESALDQLFAPVLSGVAQSPYERSPEPAVLLSRATALGASCHESRPAVLRVDLGAAGLVKVAGAIDTAAMRAIQSGITQRLRSTSAADTRFMVPFGDGGRLRFAAVGVRTARYGAPIAAYAVPDCGGVLLATSIRSALHNSPLLPHDVRGSLPNDSLVALQVRDSSGAPLLDYTAAMPRESVRQPLRAFPGAVAYLALRPGSSISLVAPPERSRLPLLIGLLGLCVALTLVALVQLRREHELARLRADFTSSVSHELRTPLAQILLFGETLSLQRARSDEERTLAATSIVREARRLMAMVDNILHFSQPRDVPEAAPERLSLQPYIEDVVAGFAPLATAASMRVETRVVPGTVQADPAMLRQVILNLLDNAVKYGRAGQTIVVQAAPENGATSNGSGPRAVRLSVSDDGPGVAPSDRERIWSPYVRLMPSGQGRRAGSGIGLAVVRELVEAMHGRTWVEAAYPDGGGARFVVELPADTRLTPRG